MNIAIVLNVMLLTVSVSAEAATTVTLRSDRPSPQLAGTGIVWTASAAGGVAPYEYRFWVQATGGTWNTLRMWSTSPTVTWVPPAQATYNVAVWARSHGNTMDDSEAIAQASFTVVLANPVSAVTLTSDRSSPQAVGTRVTWSASATGGTAPYEYKFWLQLNGGEWHEFRTWDTSPTAAWTPSTQGTYGVAVWVRSRGNNADAPEAMDQMAFTFVVSNPVAAVTLASDRSSPQLINTPITWTALAAGGVAPYEYQFWVQFNGGAWAVFRTWASSPTVVWRPSLQGTYTIAVWARGYRSTVDAPEAMTQVSFTIAVSNPVTGVTLTSDAAGPQLVGTPITWTAAAAGGVAPQQYKFWIQYNGGGWTTLRDWSTVETVSWTAPPAPGAYSVAVWARSGGATGDIAEALDQKAVTVYVCSIVVTPPNVRASSNGDSGTVAVTVEPSHCLYTPTSDVAWLNVDDPAPRSGPSTVRWTVSPNASGHDRRAVMRIGNQQVHVDQCFYGVTAPDDVVAVGGQSGTLTLTTSSSSCVWSASSGSAWLTLTGATSGTGNGTLSYSVAPNPGLASRAVIFHVAGRVVTFWQRGNQPPCEYSIDPDSITVPAEGVTQTAWVRAPAGCQWTAFTESHFVRVTSGASGSGDGDFTYTVGNNYSGDGDSNPHTERYADVRLADRVMRITQTNYEPPDNPCAAVQVTPAQNWVGPDHTTGLLHVSAPPSCSWIAASESAFIHVISGSGGTGSGTVLYTVGQNTSDEPRTGSLLVAGRIVRVSQSGLSGDGCTYTVSPTDIAVGAAQQTGTLQIATTPACEWAAESQSGFITITSGAAGSGSGSISYTLTGNPAAGGRSGVLIVAGRTVTIFQAGTSDESVTATVHVRTRGDDGNAAMFWETVDEPGEGDLTFLLECVGESYYADGGAAAFFLAVIVDGKLQAGPQTFNGRGVIQLRLRASLRNRQVVCQLITLEQRITKTDTLILPGSGPNVASVKIAGFIPAEYVPNPQTFGITIFEGDNRTFSYGGGTLRLQTIFEVLNPAVNNDDVLNEFHDTGMTVEYDRDTSTSPPPFGRLTQAARDDWVEGYPMKLRWGRAGLNQDGNVLTCERPRREGADSSARTSTHRFRCRGSVRDPLVVGGPHADWDLTFRMVYGNNQVSLTVIGCHDGFPAYEVYANGQAVVTNPSNGDAWSMFPPCDHQVDKAQVIR